MPDTRKNKPELWEEVPSEEQIRAYIVEHFGFLNDDFSFKIPQDCADPEYVWWQDFRILVSLGFNAFCRRAAEAIYASLLRLNQLPRSDAFWLNTNRRPTVSKLPDYCRYLLKHDPCDLPALWAQVALMVLGGGNDFGTQQWLALYQCGETWDVSWPIYAAVFTEINATPSAETLSRLLQQTQATEKAIPLLEQLRCSASERISGWSTDVLRLLEQGTDKEPA